MEISALKIKQKLIYVNSETTVKGKIIISNEHWKNACKLLNENAFKLFILMASEIDQSEYVLDSETAHNLLGTSYSSFPATLRELQSIGYLVKKNKTSYEFFVTPKIKLMAPNL